MAKWSKSEKSWERQPEESMQAYEAFYLYLQMGEKRNLRKVCQELAKSYTLISRWSSTWNWQQRSRDYDTDLKRQEFIATQQEIKKMQKRQIQTAMLLQKKAIEALNKLQIEDLTPKDILRFISEGAKLESQVRQEGTGTAAKEAGEDEQVSSLADTIISAYRKRMEGGESND